MMKKQDLIVQVAKTSAISQRKTALVLDGMIEVMKESLASGDDVVLSGLGILFITQRAPRRGRNPRTGEALAIPARKTVCFSAGQTLKRKIATGCKECFRMQSADSTETSPQDM